MLTRRSTRFDAGFHGDGAVLRDALLGDIHLRQNLESGNDGHELRFRRRRQRAQLAVDPQPNRAGILERFEVNVAGARPQGLVENLVHHADHAAVGPRRRRRVELQDVVVELVLLRFLFLLLLFLLLAYSSRRLMNFVRAARIERVQGLLDHRKRRHHRPDVHAREQLQLVAHQHVLERGEGHVQGVAANLHRHEHVLAAELFGQHAGQLRVHVLRRNVEQRHHEVVGIDLGDMLVENEPLLHQQALQRAVILGSGLAEVLDLLGREYLLLQQRAGSRAVANALDNSAVLAMDVTSPAFRELLSAAGVLAARLRGAAFA